MTQLSRNEVISRLQAVVDPCSAATGVSLSIVEMGMIESVEFESEVVVIHLRMTSPLCHAPPYFEMEIERVLANHPSILGVKCVFDHGGNWQPDNMTSKAQKKLTERREIVQGRFAHRANRTQL
jgi:metal-sulfur cluster biosynthetic enzyme